MKAKTLTLICTTILTAIIIGAALTQPVAPIIISARIAWKPEEYAFGTIPPDIWIVRTRLPDPFKPTLVEHLDFDSIRLEGLYPAISLEQDEDRVLIAFSGWDVVAAISSKVVHMTPGIEKVWLEVSGKTVTGEDWAGLGDIEFINPPPPPLPPP